MFVVSVFARIDCRVSEAEDSLFGVWFRTVDIFIIGVCSFFQIPIQDLTTFTRMQLVSPFFECCGPAPSALGKEGSL